MNTAQFRSVCFKAEDFSISWPLHNTDELYLTAKSVLFHECTRLGGYHPDFKSFHKWKTGIDLTDHMQPHVYRDNLLTAIEYLAFTYSNEKLHRASESAMHARLDITFTEKQPDYDRKDRL